MIRDASNSRRRIHTPESPQTTRESGNQAEGTSPFTLLRHYENDEEACLQALRRLLEDPLKRR